MVPKTHSSTTDCIQFPFASVLSRAKLQKIIGAENDLFQEETKIVVNLTSSSFIKSIKCLQVLQFGQTTDQLMGLLTTNKKNWRTLFFDYHCSHESTNNDFSASF